VNSDFSLSRKFHFLSEPDICKFVPVFDNPSYVVVAHLDYTWVRISGRRDFNAKARRAHEEEVCSAFGCNRKQNARSLD